MTYYDEAALREFAKQQHRSALTAEENARLHRDRRDSYLRELRSRGWKHQQLADLLDVTEGAIRRMLREKRS